MRETQVRMTEGVAETERMRETEGVSETEGVRGRMVEGGETDR